MRTPLEELSHLIAQLDAWQAEQALNQHDVSFVLNLVAKLRAVEAKLKGEEHPIGDTMYHWEDPLTHKVWPYWVRVSAGDGHARHRTYYSFDAGRNWHRTFMDAAASVGARVEGSSTT